MRKAKPTPAATPPRPPRLELVRETVRRIDEAKQSLTQADAVTGVDDQTSFTCNNTADPAS